MSTTVDSPHGPYRVLAGVVTGYFMVQLVLVPVSAMLPTLSDEFEVSVGQIGWLMTIYLISLTCLQLFAGRLGDQLSHQRVFLLGVIIFGIASLLAALCVSYWQIILCRLLQGLGAALLSGNSLAIVHKVFPAETRGRAISLLTSAAAMGSILGIVIGAVFIQFLSWRVVFLLCLPVALISFLLMYRREAVSLKIDWKKIDFPGGILLCLFLIFLSFCFGTSRHDHAAAASSHLVSMINWQYLFIALLCLYLFVKVERKSSNPLVFFEQFRNSVFTASTVSNFILHFEMMCVVFFIPFVVEKGLGLLPIFAAVVLLAQEFMNAILPYVGGYLYHKRKWRWILPAAAAVITSGMFVYYLMVDQVGAGGLYLLGSLIGFGMGIYLSINNHIMMSTLQDQYRGFASGMLETTRQMGHTLSVGLSAVVMGSALDMNTGDAGKMALFSGTKSILLMAFVVSIFGLLCALIIHRPTFKPRMKVTPSSPEVG
jgi:fucose permease